jgi:hypothetical protein
MARNQGAVVLSDEASDVRQDLAEWSEPIIADYLHDAYAERIGADHRSLRTLVSAHCRFWRALLIGNMTKMTINRRELAVLARLAHVPVTLVDAVDVGVLDELMNVIMARFMRSPGLARDYSHVLLRIAAHLSRAHTVLV